MIKSSHYRYPFQNLIIVDAEGTLDLPASKGLLKKLAADPKFDAQTEVLLDLRDVNCRMSTLDVYEIASFLAWPDPALPTRKKIAVLVEGRAEFDHALFLEMCTANAGVRLAAFDDYNKANDWLNADLPPDPKES